MLVGTTLHPRCQFLISGLWPQWQSEASCVVECWLLTFSVGTMMVNINQQWLVVNINHHCANGKSQIMVRLAHCWLLVNINQQ